MYIIYILTIYVYIYIYIDTKEMYVCVFTHTLPYSEVSYLFLSS